MKKKLLTLFAFGVSLILVGCASTTPTTETPVAEVPSGPVPAGSPTNTTLPVPYISAQENWPVTIQDSTTPYSCNKTDISETKQISEKVINNKTYCIIIENEGAAGSIYSTYTYTTANGSNTKITSFTLRSTNCGVYDEPELTQCNTAQSNFDLDAIIASLM